jgi:hypothetical protein
MQPVTRKYAGAYFSLPPVTVIIGNGSYEVYPRSAILVQIRRQ